MRELERYLHLCLLTRVRGYWGEERFVEGDIVGLLRRQLVSRSRKRLVQLRERDAPKRFAAIGGGALRHRRAVPIGGGALRHRRTEPIGVGALRHHRAVPGRMDRLGRAASGTAPPTPRLLAHSARMR